MDKELKKEYNIVRSSLSYIYVSYREICKTNFEQIIYYKNKPSEVATRKLLGFLHI